MTDISKARQALRDYARTGVVIDHTEVVHIEGQPGKVAVARSLGEMAGKAFVAAQAALTVTEELRAEADGPVNPNLFDWQAAGIELVKQAQREAAERLEAAILKALS